MIPDNAKQLDLSVLVYMPHHHSWLDPLLRALRDQTCAQNLEVIVVIDSRSVFNAGEEVLHGFGRSVLLEAPHAASYIGAKLEGVRIATAPVIAFAEDHCFPEPAWAERLIHAHASDCAAVGPQMVDANPGTAMSRALFALHWGRWSGEATAGNVDALPPHNTSYKKNLLMQHFDLLEDMFAVEANFHSKLRNEGHRFVYEPAAVTWHCNISKFMPWCATSYHGGRLYASRRVLFENDSTTKRIIRGLTSPLVPFVRLKREASIIWSTGGSPVDRMCALAMAFLGVAIHSAGEAMGYFAGAGASEAACADYETSRFRDMREDDLMALRSAASRRGLEPALMS
jgi:hypothetical protein